MTPHTDRAVGILRHRRAATVVALAVTLGGLGLSGCSAISKVKSVAHNVETNRKTMDSFTTKIQSDEAKPFQATYVTTGDNPTTVVYAVQPPKGLSFTNTPSSTSSAGTGGAAVPNVDIIVNSTGEYSCTPPDTSGTAGKGTWACQMLSPGDAQEQNAIFDFYTPAHWVNFLKGFSLAAGFAGDKVTSSTMTVNGFAMSCVDFATPGESGESTICTTAQGILGYVKVAGDTTSFEIKSYSASPDASLFELPPGATVTLVQVASSPAA
jgi:outer membrane murein-binding lipoprotein Lpp